MLAAFFCTGWRAGEWHPSICRPVGALDGGGGTSRTHGLRHGLLSGAACAAVDGRGSSEFIVPSYGGRRYDARAARKRRRGRCLQGMGETAWTGSVHKRVDWSGATINGPIPFCRLRADRLTRLWMSAAAPSPSPRDSSA